jgi:hypothetical protein
MSFYEVEWKNKKNNPSNGGTLRIEHNTVNQAKDLAKRYIMASGISQHVVITHVEKITFINENEVLTLEIKKQKIFKD